MAGTEVVVGTREYDRLVQRLERFRRRVSNPAQIMHVVAGTMESQTRRRLQDTKKDPDGSPWAKWSTEYAATRGGQHSLLVSSQALLDDVASDFGRGFARVFSSMEYAATHQHGRTEDGIPARPYLGIGAGDAREIEDVCTDWMVGAL